MFFRHFTIMRSFATKFTQKPYLNRIVLSNTILKSLPDYCPPESFQQVFQQTLNNFSKNRSPHDYFTFPLTSFKIFRNDLIEKWIKNSYHVFNLNGLLNVSYYNVMMKSYITHDINFDALAIFDEIKRKGIKPISATYGIFVEIFSAKGDMNNVQTFIDLMKEEHMPIDFNLKKLIYCGFIKAGKPDEAKQFLIDENLDENDIAFLTRKVKTYATMGNIKEVMETLERISLIDKEIKNRLVSHIYLRMVKANATDSELEQIMIHEDGFKDRALLSNLIYNLNRQGYYSHSWKLFIKYKNVIKGRLLLTKLVLTYSDKNCPIEIYKRVLKDCIDSIDEHVPNLFENIDFETANTIVGTLINGTNSQCLFSNLLENAFESKVIENIAKTIQSANKGLNENQFNFLIYAKFLQLMTDNEIIEQPEHIIALLPELRQNILHGLFLRHLCNGDYGSFNALLATYPTAPMKCVNYSLTITKSIFTNVPLNDLPKFKSEALKVFLPSYVNWLLSGVIIERIKQLAEIHDNRSMEAAIDVARAMDVTFTSDSLKYLERHAPFCGEIINEMLSSHR